MLIKKFINKLIWLKECYQIIIHLSKEVDQLVQVKLDILHQVNYHYNYILIILLKIHLKLMKMKKIKI